MKHSRGSLSSWVVLVAGTVLALTGCEDSGPAATDTYTFSKPAHPAMHVKSPSGGGASPSAGGARPARTPMPVPQEGASGGSKRSLAAELAALGLAVTVPDGWQEVPTTSQFRMATLQLPRVDGDDADGEMSLSAVGGDVASNIERWKGQFLEAPEPVTRTLTTEGGVEVTVVEMSGTFSPGPMARGASPKAGTKLLGAIAKVPGGQRKLFIKSWGPENTMERWRNEFDAFVASLELVR